MMMPPAEPDFTVVQPETVLGAHEAFLDRPAQASGSARATTGSGRIEQVLAAQPASTKSFDPPATEGPRRARGGQSIAISRRKAGASFSSSLSDEPFQSFRVPSTPLRPCRYSPLRDSRRNQNKLREATLVLDWLRQQHQRCLVNAALSSLGKL